MIIYKFENRINGKVYIGQTIHSLKERVQGHLKSVRGGAKTYFHNALRKYGIHSFDICILDVANDIKILNKKEKYWISFYNSIDSSIGYNLTDGGKNSIPTEEVRRKIGLKNSIRLKGKPSSFKGKHHTNKAKELIRRNGKWNPVNLAKGRGWNKGKKLGPRSEETKKKLKEASLYWWSLHPEERPRAKKTLSYYSAQYNDYWKGKKKPKEIGDRISKSLKGKEASKETRNKMSKSQIERWKKRNQ